MTLLSEAKRMFLAGTAIYAGEDFIDVARAVKSSGGLDVSVLQRFPLAKNIRSMPYTQARDVIDNILDVLFQGDAGRPYRIAANLGNEDFVLRYFTLRDIPEKELKNAVIFEAQRYLPYPIDDIIYKYVSFAKKKGLSEISFVAAETKTVMSIAEYFKGRNILASIIEPAPFLLGRALDLDENIDKTGTYIMLHYEPINKVMISGVCHTHPRFFREVRLFQGDEEFKTAELVYLQLKEVWPMIENDVINSMEYLRKETNADINKIVISGFPRSPDDQDISKNFGVPFEWLGLTSFHGIDMPDKDRYAPVLALLHDSLHKPVMNLAPPEIVSRDAWSLKPVALKGGIILAAVLLLHAAFSVINLAESKKVSQIKSGFAAHRALNKDASTQDVLRYETIFEEKNS